jgi:hypothetical protein
MKLAKTLIIILIISSCTIPNLSARDKKLLYIAKKEWKRVFNDLDVDNYEPYNIKLVDSVWVITGSLEEGREGGVPVAVIDTVTLKVVDVYHTK